MTFIAFNLCIVYILRHNKLEMELVKINLMCTTSVTPADAGKCNCLSCTCTLCTVKVGVSHPVQQPGSYWDRSSVLPLVGLEPTEVTAYD